MALPGKVQKKVKFAEDNLCGDEPALTTASLKPPGTWSISKEEEHEITITKEKLESYGTIAKPAQDSWAKQTATIGTYGSTTSGQTQRQK